MKLNKYRNELVRAIIFFGPLDRSEAKKKVREAVEQDGFDWCVLTFNEAENLALKQKAIYLERDPLRVKEDYFRGPYIEEAKK